MVSVLQVYTALKDLANKEQKGFITPQVFNSFASLAQMNIYNEMFSELIDAKRLSRQNFDPGRDKSVRKQREEDLSMYLRTEFMSVPFIEKPSDLSKTISITADTITDGGDATSRTNLMFTTQRRWTEYLVVTSLLRRKTSWRLFRRRTLRSSRLRFRPLR